MSASEVQPHPVFAQRISEVAEKLEKAGQRAFAADLYDIAAALTPRGEELRQRAAALRRGAGGEDTEREHKRHNLEASHAVGMARVFEVRGELGRAQEMFDLGKLRAPFHYLAYAGAGYLHLRRRDLRAALEEFVQARRLNPLDRKLAIEAARVALELEEYQEALRHAVDALLLSQGLGEAEEAAARRRVDTLGALCKYTREDLAELHRQRAAALQRACEQVALTRARLFSTLALAEPRTPRRIAPSTVRDDLLKVALELRRFRAFRHLSDPQLLELAQTGKRETFRHAQILTREGQDERDVLILVEGKLHACRRTPLGTQVLSALSLGDIAGEISFLDRKPRSTTLVGVDGGAVLRLAARDLDQLATRSEDLGVALLWAFWHSLSAKVRSANAAMTEIITPGAVPRRTSSGQPGERVTVDPSVKLDILREQGLSASELRLLASYSREERFPPEALIFAEGEPGDTLYIVMEGQVRISRRLPGMGEEALTILGRGEVFGEMSLIDEQARSADARAHTEGCTVFTVDRQRLEEVLEMDPDAARQFLTLLCTILCRRIRAMNDRLVAWRVMAGHE
ncbi:MAG: cyclic nucleotide-binding domain-containing protein [Acidobacteriota bacterium]